VRVERQNEPAIGRLDLRDTQIVAVVGDRERRDAGTARYVADERPGEIGLDMIEVGACGDLPGSRLDPQSPDRAR
jgi:hypothetical protein